jgi:tetratricopeptide (TPR) repeat protein
MHTTQFKALFLVVFVSMCLNVSHAQQPSAVLNQTLGSIQPTTSTNPTGTAPTIPAATPATGALANSADTTGPKYSEYQSICRTNDYDTEKYFSDELKSKRLNLLNSKIDTKNPKDSVKIQLRLIKELLDQGEKEKIKDLVKTLKATKITDAENAQLNALVAISEKNYALARDTLNKVAIVEKRNIELLSLLAEVYMQLENYYEATTIYEDLDLMTKNNFLVQLCEASVLNLLNAEGEKICLQAARKFPNSPFPQIFIGITYREREDIITAANAFKKSINIKPTEMATTCLAEVFYMRQNFKDAITLFKRSLDLSPKSIRSVLGLAWAQLKLKNYDDAIDTFQKACKANKKFETDVRTAYKILMDDKIPEANKFIKLADTCSRY